MIEIQWKGQGVLSSEKSSECVQVLMYLCIYLTDEYKRRKPACINSVLFGE